MSRIFETSKIQQNEVDQETIRALTSWIDELNEKSANLTAKLEKCKALTDRLYLAEQWKSRMKDILAETGEKLETSATLAMNISMDVADVLNVLDKVSA